jgi:hypothetical protein
MAFTGVATVVKVSDRKFRITGLSLEADASGTIGFSDKDVPSEVSLIAPEWKPYRNGEADLVSLQDSVECRTQPVTDVDVAVPIVITKTGTDHGDFEITLHNDGDAACDEVTLRVTLARGNLLDPPVVITVDDCTITAHMRGVVGELGTGYASMQTLIDALNDADIGAEGEGDLASPVEGPQDLTTWVYEGTLNCVDGVLTTLDALTDLDPTPPAAGQPNPITVESGPLDSLTFGGGEWEGCAGAGTASANLEIYVEFH